MSFWTALAAAYRETRDEKYARAFVRQFTDWLAQTGGIPPERDFNTVGSPWRTIEEGIRLYTSWSFDKKTDVFTITDHVTSSDRRPHADTLLFHLDTTNTVVSTDGRRLR